ncbi:hypothetical protein P389DRAFT_192924 [Cystobasidium minutum MCA 4210]|uniref:uncharacterized protein n=1 Tax=Cystobasidium minutum MCA 4210 TaxID=1397322 RepID=UPI0034CE56D6|eukprot:jgi/Rhomi1/192924/gm1.1138_g
MVNSQEINAAEQLVFGNERADTNDFKSFEKPALSDLLTIESSLSVFYDYVRQSETLVKRLTTNTPTTLFAPQDSAILSLHRKPHQGPVASSVNDAALSEEEEDKEMRAYLEKWTKAYMVDGVDFKLEDGIEVQSLAGQDSRVAFTAAPEGGEQDWQQVLVQPGNARIVAAKEARDGRLYIIDRVLQ